MAETLTRDQILREQSALAARVAELANPDIQRLAALAEAERELAARQEQLDGIKAAELAAATAKVMPQLNEALVARAKAFAAFIATESAVEKAAKIVEDVVWKPVAGSVSIFGLREFLGTLAVQHQDPAGFAEAKLRIVSLANNRIAVESIK